MAKQVTSNAPAVAQPAAPAVKGAAMASRWGACLRGNGQPVMGNAIFAMPPATIITCMVAANPKGGASAPAFSAYGFGGKPSKQAIKGGAVTLGATTTLGAYYSALLGLMAQNAKAAAAHVAWDLNHNYIAISSPAAQPAPPVAQAA